MPPGRGAHVRQGFGSDAGANQGPRQPAGRGREPGSGRQDRPVGCRAVWRGTDAQGGILLAGSVTAVGVQGDLHGAAVRMDGQDRSVSVLSGQSLAVKKDEKVLILGHLVRDPGKNLAGYTGTQPVVVWAILAMKLP